MYTYENKQDKQETRNIGNVGNVENNPLQLEDSENQTMGFVDNRPKAIYRRTENKTGLPDGLKTGVENLSGLDMSDVRVHRNSPKPAALRAHAYTQGTDIHLGPGQERHLPHEAWHVVQQKQGRVESTRQMKGGVNINDDAGLEKEADRMGTRALHTTPHREDFDNTSTRDFRTNYTVLQRKEDETNDAVGLELLEYLQRNYPGNADFIFMKLMTYFKGDALKANEYLQETLVYAGGNPEEAQVKLFAYMNLDLETEKGKYREQKERIIEGLPQLLEELGIADKSIYDLLLEEFSTPGGNMLEKIQIILMEADKRRFSMTGTSVEEERREQRLQELGDEFSIMEYLAGNIKAAYLFHSTENEEKAKELHRTLLGYGNRELNDAIFVRLIAKHQGDAAAAVVYLKRFNPVDVVLCINFLAPRTDEIDNGFRLLETLAGLSGITVELFESLLSDIKQVFGDDLERAALYVPRLVSEGDARAVHEITRAAIENAVEGPSMLNMLNQILLASDLGVSTQHPLFEQLQGLMNTGDINLESFLTVLEQTARMTGTEPINILARLASVEKKGNFKDYLELIQYAISLFSSDFRLIYKSVARLLEIHYENASEALAYFKSVGHLFKNNPDYILKYISEDNRYTQSQLLLAKEGIHGDDIQIKILSGLLELTGGKADTGVELFSQLLSACNGDLQAANNLMDTIMKTGPLNRDQRLNVLKHTLSTMETGDLDKDGYYIAMNRFDLEPDQIIPANILYKHGYDEEPFDFVKNLTGKYGYDAAPVEELFVSIMDISGRDIHRAQQLFNSLSETYGSDITQILDLLKSLRIDHLDKNEMQEYVMRFTVAEQMIIDKLNASEGGDAGVLIPLVRPLLNITQDESAVIQILERFFNAGFDIETIYNRLEELVIKADSKWEALYYLSLLEKHDSSIEQARSDFMEQKKSESEEETDESMESEQPAYSAPPEERKIGALHEVSRYINKTRPRVWELVDYFETVKNNFNLSDIRFASDSDGFSLNFSASPPTKVDAKFVAKGKEIKLIPTPKSKEESSVKSVTTTAPKIDPKTKKQMIDPKTKKPMTVTTKTGWDAGYNHIIKDDPQIAHDVIKSKFQTVVGEKFQKPKGTYSRPYEVEAWKEGKSDSKGRSDPSLVKNIGKLGEEERDLKEAEKNKKDAKTVKKALTAVEDFEYRGGHLVAYNILGDDSNISQNIAPQTEKFNHPAYYTLFEQVNQKTTEKVTINIKLSYKNDTYRISKEALEFGGYIKAPKPPPKKAPKAPPAPAPKKPVKADPPHVDLPTRIPNQWEATVKTDTAKKALGVEGGLGSFSDRVAITQADFNKLKLTYSDVQGYAIFLKVGAVTDKKGKLTGSGGTGEKIHIIAKQQDFS